MSKNVVLETLDRLYREQEVRQIDEERLNQYLKEYNELKDTVLVEGYEMSFESYANLREDEFRGLTSKKKKVLIYGLSFLLTPFGLGAALLYAYRRATDTCRNVCKNNKQVDCYELCNVKAAKMFAGKDPTNKEKWEKLAQKWQEKADEKKNAAI